MALEQERTDTQWCPYCKRHVPLAMHVHDEWEPPPDPRVPEEAWPEWLFYVLMGTIVAGVTFALVAALVWQ